MHVNIGVVNQFFLLRYHSIINFPLFTGNASVDLSHTPFTILLLLQSTTPDFLLAFLIFMLGPPTTYFSTVLAFFFSHSPPPSLHLSSII